MRQEELKGNPLLCPEWDMNMSSLHSFNEKNWKLLFVCLPELYIFLHVYLYYLKDKTNYFCFLTCCWFYSVQRFNIVWMSLILQAGIGLQTTW